MSGPDWAWLIAKVGDVVKGSGKGDMATGMKLIVSGAAVLGGMATEAARKVGSLFRKKKDERKNN